MHFERRHGLCAIALIASLGFAGCGGETLRRGYVPSDTALQQVRVGAYREEVLLTLGTPSTTADFGGEVFYYISQTSNRPIAFMNFHVVDQKILAVYFDENNQVKQIADYGLQDGQIFDFVTRTTPTGGKDFSFLSQIFAGVGKLSI